MTNEELMEKMLAFIDTKDGDRMDEWYSDERSLYAMPLEEFAQFIEIRPRLVMFFLSLDVFDHRVAVAMRDGECPVSILPVREIRKDTAFFDPQRRGDLDVFHQIRQRDGRMHAG